MIFVQCLNHKSCLQHDTRVKLRDLEGVHKLSVLIALTAFVLTSCIIHINSANLTAVFHAWQHRAEAGHVGPSTNGATSVRSP